ncbi:sensor histidine kinase [Thauera sp. JM12B12]|uniref:sensor histidine kinase n=1 Tax=Thauera sp. JM12B12 TaxID=3142262 RepID=UPI0031F4065F
MPAVNPASARGGLGSLRLRLLAGTLVWVALTVVVAGWGLGRLFNEHVERQFNAELGTHLEQLAAQLTLDVDDRPALRGALSDPRFARPYSGLYWQIDGIDPDRRGALRSRSLWDGVLVVPGDRPADGERHVHQAEGPDGARLQLVEQALHPAERPELRLRLIVAANAALIDEPVARFNRLLVLALGLLAGGLAVAALVQVRVGLRPLARLRDGLAAVRDGRVGAIQGRFPAEVQPLVDEFNAVLVRNAEVVERARTHAGNLAHAVKTPLAVLANAAEQAADDAAAATLARLVREQVGLARTQVEHHLARARAAAAVGVPGQRTPLRPVIEGLLRLMGKVHAARALQFELSACDPQLAFRGEAQDLHEMLGNLIDNASKWAARQVRVQVDVHGSELVVRIDDDGPGLRAEAREAVFARGVRADERTPGSGLGLSIVRELAQLYGGGVALLASPLGGLRAELRLPLAA